MPKNITNVKISWVSFLDGPVPVSNFWANSEILPMDTSKPASGRSLLGLRLWNDPAWNDPSGVSFQNIPKICWRSVSLKKIMASEARKTWHPPVLAWPHIFKIRNLTWRCSTRPLQRKEATWVPMHGCEPPWVMHSFIPWSPDTWHCKNLCQATSTCCWCDNRFQILEKLW